jgi:hypothetical protein
MFILDGTNNRSESNSTNGAFFLLGTDKPCHGALLGVVGAEGSSSVQVTLPPYQGDTVVLNVQGLPLRRLDAIEVGGYRYLQATGELQPGEFFWDVGRKIILIKLFSAKDG